MLLIEKMFSPPIPRFRLPNAGFIPGDSLPGRYRLDIRYDGLSFQKSTQLSTPDILYTVNDASPLHIIYKEFILTAE